MARRDRRQGSNRTLWQRLRGVDPHAEWRPPGEEEDGTDAGWRNPVAPAAVAPPAVPGASSDARTDTAAGEPAAEDDWGWRPEEDPDGAAPSGRASSPKEPDAEPSVLAVEVRGPGSAGAPDDSLLLGEELVRTYPGRVGVTAVRGASILVRPGDFIALMGPSGSGKSTLLGLLAGLDRPDEGRVLWRGGPMEVLDQEAVRRLRQRELGMVFQSFGLLPTLSALENVELPLRISGTPLDEARESAEGWLARLGLGHRLDNRTFELSAGQQQRVAVARALVIEPDVVLADEPIAEVDSENADLILEALAEVSRRGGAVVVATHNPAAVAYATSVVLLRDGRVEATGSPEELVGRLSTD